MPKCYDDDVPPAPCEPPTGFAFTTSPPSVAALAFSKNASEAADSLIGSSILFHWPVIGWHQGSLQRRNFDGRIKRSGESCNFYVYYEVDDDEVVTPYLPTPKPGPHPPYSQIQDVSDSGCYSCADGV